MAVETLGRLEEASGVFLEVPLMAAVYLEALGRLEEASGVFLEVPHMVVVDSEDMDWAMEVGILMESVAVASDYQVDLVAEVGPADLEENFQEVAGPIVLADLVGSLEAEDLHHRRRLRRHTALLLPRRQAGRNAMCRSRARSRS